MTAISREALRAHFITHPEAGYAVTLNLATVVGSRLQLFLTIWQRKILEYYPTMTEFRVAAGVFAIGFLSIPQRGGLHRFVLILQSADHHQRKQTGLARA